MPPNITGQLVNYMRSQGADPSQADIVWLVYKLAYNEDKKLYSLERVKKVYTLFNESLNQIARPAVGSPDVFVEKLQEKLDDKLDSNPPETSTIEVERLGDSGTV